MCPPEGKSENYVNKGGYELRKTEREKPDSELFRFFSLKYNREPFVSLQQYQRKKYNKLSLY